MEDRKEIDKRESQPGDDCTFKKGICKKHNIAAVRKVVTSKKWASKKDGLQGWSYSKKIKWYCKLDAESTPAAPEKASVESYTPSQAAPVGIHNGLPDNNLKRSDLSESNERGLGKPVIEK